jgi:RHS repeat-associated protein
VRLAQIRQVNRKQKTKKEEPEMKTTINILLAFAAVSVNLHAMNQAPPAPLPDFMDKAQLAKWNADQAAVRAASTPAPAESSNQFYTGKPYVADVDGYIYKYRTYNPEMSRWTSADPSGFPDGVNNHLYTANPLSNYDAEGLTVLTSTYDVTITPDEWGAPSVVGWSLTDLNITINLTGSGAGSTAAPTNPPGISGVSATMTGSQTGASYGVALVLALTYTASIGTPTLNNTTDTFSGGEEYLSQEYWVNVYVASSFEVLGVTNTDNTLVATAVMFLTDVGE